MEMEYIRQEVRPSLLVKDYEIKLNLEALAPVECNLFCGMVGGMVKGVVWLHNRPNYPSAPTRTDGSRKL
uniref:Uncharacterized protein n=1 Tax=Timema genevievae TaxID=629358 RepID=A0A7R9JTE1_TIMGE|nr:unnamed protein product [Timema genevievae]